MKTIHKQWQENTHSETGKNKKHLNKTLQIINSLVLLKKF